MLLKLPLWDFFKNIYDKGEYATLLPFDKQDYWMFVMGTLGVLVLVGISAFLLYLYIHNWYDEKKATVEKLSGVLIDKKLTSDMNNPDIFLLFVKSNGTTYKIFASMQDYYNKDIGQKLNFEIQRGGITKNILDSNLV